MVSHRRVMWSVALVNENAQCKRKALYHSKLSMWTGVWDLYFSAMKKRRKWELEQDSKSMLASCMSNE